MEEPTNPFKMPPKTEQHPVDSNLETTRQQKSDKIVMLSLIAATSILAGIDALVFQLGYIVVFGPPMLFFAITFWAIIAGTRHGTLAFWKRITAAIIGGLLAAPCFEILLVATCVPTTEIAGVSYDLYYGVGPSERYAFALITAVLIAAVGLLIWWLTHSLPKQLKIDSIEVQN